MIARLQQFTTLGFLTGALAWGVFFAQRGRWLLSIVGALLIVFGYTAFLAAEFTALYLVHREDPAPRASLAQLVRAWIGEALTAPTVFCWRQPFFSRSEPDHLRAVAPRRPGVVLVHGLLCNRAVWNPWMRKLRARNIAFVAVDLEPVFGSIDHYPALIENAVRAVEAATGAAPVLVGHSMGGLAVRRWLSTQPSKARVRRIITVGTPHHGTWLARFGRSESGRQMRVGSPWLADLAEHEQVGSRQHLFTCFYSHCDNIVFPPSTATLPGADNRHVPGSAHVQMLFRPEVFDEVLRWVEPAPG